MNYNKPLKCPFCRKKLTKGVQQKYETLLEHVCDPNMEDYPLRDTWVCSCEESKDSFWDWYGDFYSKKFGFHKNSTSAINSASRQSDSRYKQREMLSKNIVGRKIVKAIDSYFYWRYKMIEKKNRIV